MQAAPAEAANAAASAVGHGTIALSYTTTAPWSPTPRRFGGAGALTSWDAAISAIRGMIWVKSSGSITTHQEFAVRPDSLRAFSWGMAVVARVRISPIRHRAINDVPGVRTAVIQRNGSFCLHKLDQITIRDVVFARFLLLDCGK